MLEQDTHAAKADKFWSTYFQDPDPTQVPDALADNIDAGVFQDSGSVAWYLFVRIARDHPSLIRQYEALFLSKPEGRLVLAKVLLQVGDKRSIDLLNSHLYDPALEPLRDEIQGALESRPTLMDPLAHPATTPADLDLLWCEFRATGSTEPVLRIIDVFERPDRIRSKLQEWLHEDPPEAPFSWFWAARRRRVARALWKHASILCDLDRREVLSSQDLDCHCTVQDMEVSGARLQAVARLLPFSLYGEYHLLHVKACAKWSLASHAYEHSVIAELCRSEAEKRTGRCRVLLLEMTAFVALQQQDLETAFTALGESLTPDPETRRVQNAAAEAEWECLARLSPESASVSADKFPQIRETVMRAVQETLAGDTYRTKRIIRTAGRSGLGPGDVVWECEVALPANFRVFQTMWWESEKVYDEWISLGDEYFRGPFYQSMPGVPRIESAFLVAPYLRVLQDRKPAGVSMITSEGISYLVLEYEGVASSIAPWYARLANAVGIPIFRGKTVLWVDGESGRLVKVTQTIKPSVRSGAKPTEIILLFSCYGEPVAIVPPAFDVVGPMRPTLRTRLTAVIRQWTG